MFANAKKMSGAQKTIEVVYSHQSLQWYSTFPLLLMSTAAFLKGTAPLLFQSWVSGSATLSTPLTKAKPIRTCPWSFVLKETKRIPFPIVWQWHKNMIPQSLESVSPPPKKNKGITQTLKQKQRHEVHTPGSIPLGTGTTLVFKVAALIPHPSLLVFQFFVYF
jgi:hypothetical protein